MAEPVVHLATLGTRFRAACGKWSKWLSGSTANVTCPECRKTWDFAIARRGEVRDA